MFTDGLDHHLIHGAPTPVFMGELPRDYADVPAPVVVNLCGLFPNGVPYGRFIFGFPMLDALDDRLLPPRDELEAFLAAVHLHSSIRASYWHCHAGINRSGLALAAYLHLYRGFRISDAITHLRVCRSNMVLCNHLFERTLRTWYGTAEEQSFDPAPVATWIEGRVTSRDPGEF